MLLLSEGLADEAEESVALERSALIMFRYKLAFAFGGTWSSFIFVTSHKIAYKIGESFLSRAARYITAVTPVGSVTDTDISFAFQFAAVYLSL